SGTLTDGGVELNQHSGTTDALADWTTYGLDDTFKFGGDLVAVSGKLTGLSLAGGVLTGGISFAVSAQSLTGVSLPDGSTTGELLTVSLSDPDLTLGVSGFGAAVTSGTLTFAALART